MTALLSEAPATPVEAPRRLNAPWRPVDPALYPARKPSTSQRPCLTKPRDLALAPPSVRVRALNTAHVGAEREHLSAIQTHTRAMAAAAGAVLKSPVASLAFFLSRRPSMLAAKHGGKFRA